MKISPHKGGRTARFEARCTPDDKETLTRLAETHEASTSDVLAGMIKSLNDLSIIEAHAMIHGITAWAHVPGVGLELGRTILLFGNGDRVVQDANGVEGRFSLEDVEEFFMGLWWDSVMMKIPMDKSLLDA